MNYRRVFIENGYVHLIIVAYNRQPIFIQNINLLKQAIINSKKYFNYELIAICVLPEHIHMILYPENIKDYPKIITSIKYYFSHNINVGETPTYQLFEYFKRILLPIYIPIQSNYQHFLAQPYSALLSSYKGISSLPQYNVVPHTSLHFQVFL